MEIKRTEAAIEAILFAMGESVELSRIATAVGQDKDTTPQAAASHDGPVSGGGQGDPDHRAGTVLSDVHEKKRCMNI